MITAGLKTEVQCALTIVHDIDTFEELVDAAVQIDHVNFALAKADSKPPANKSSSQGKGNTPSLPRPQQPRTTDNTSSVTSNASRTPSSKFTSFHNPISQEEKDRREALGLCRFCGGNHFKRDCPSLKAKLEKEASKGPPPRYPTPASTSSVNSDSAPVNVSHIISGKFRPQSQ